MYLREIHIRHSGPVNSLDLELELASDGSPVTNVLLGLNGSGKTNVLSLIGDALFEAASTCFDDLLLSQGVSRKWFRVVGSNTISHGKPGGFSVLKFTTDENAYYYVEKAGTYPLIDAKSTLPPDSSAAIQWDESGNTKQFKIAEDVARNAFENGAYAYFPSSRSEYPHWLNLGALKEDQFSTDQRFSTELGKPLFVEKGIQKFSQWLMGVMADARIDVGPFMHALITSQVDGQIEATSLMENFNKSAKDVLTYNSGNKILKAILGDESARFMWAGRHYPKKILIHRGDGIIIPGLDALSAGQASLLSIFGTLLRYGDSKGAKSAAEVEGICIIDEVDAHLHVEHQIKALPTLIGIFPKIQFLLSGHSPLFVLGLHKELGEKVRFIDLPSGATISAESYSEFQHAFDTLRDTRAFAEAITADMSASQKAKIWVEGETDPVYLETAARLLGFDELLDAAQFEWVGAKDRRSGQGFNSGKDALNAAFAFLQANPSLLARKVVLLYDCDANKMPVDEGELFVRSLGRNEQNSKAKKGIENLLPERVFSDDAYDTVTRERDYGGSVTTRTLNKMRLCETLTQDANPETYEGFRPILTELSSLLLGASN